MSHATFMVSILCFLGIVICYDDNYYKVCPVPICLPEYIPPECRKPTIFIGSDCLHSRETHHDTSATEDRVLHRGQSGACYVGWCSDYKVCLIHDCFPEYIPPECRKRNLFIGDDGFTICEACDTSLCSNSSCPEILCPALFIPPKCRKSNFIIGADGITRCKLCDTSICGKRRQVCPKIDCPERIPRNVGCHRGL